MITAVRMEGGKPEQRRRSGALFHCGAAASRRRLRAGTLAHRRSGRRGGRGPEACLRAFRGIGGFAGTNARAWLLTIVRHAAYTWLGKNRSASLLVVEDLEAVELQQVSGAAAFAQDAQTPEAALIAKADAQRLESAIAELPVPFRETLVLRDVQGLDYREIAEVTKVPIGTVMSRLARARRRLIERIAMDEARGGS
jgi:RNA polymerase sigma factor (sigma-70 family)